MKILFKTITGTIIICISLISYTYAENTPTKKITATGSSTIAPLLSEIAKRYETKNNARIEIQTGGSSRGIADIHKGITDIGMSSRALFPQEKKGLKTYTVALDGVAFVVNKSNPLSVLSTEQAKDIYTGKIKNWKELGGEDKEITVVNRSKSRSELKLVSKFLKIKSNQIKADIVAGENQHAIKLIEGNKHSIAYISVGETEYEINNGKNLKALKLDDVAANSENVKNQTYPLIRPLILISKPTPSKEVEAFINYSLSKDVADLVRNLSFVPAN